MAGIGAAINTGNVQRGDSVAVIGCGGVGTAAVAGAALAGATTVIAVDIDAKKLERAKEMGATHTIDSSTADPVEAIRELTGGGAGFTFNTTRSPRVYDQMVDALAPQGTAGFVGPPEEGWEPDLTAIMHGGHAIMGIVQGGVAADVIVPLLIDLHRQGRFPFDRLIREYAFEDIEAAFRDSEAGATIKPVLRMTD
jgi:aryl-alcohol dehydrogenase